jgi:hypothetical protein
VDSGVDSGGCANWFGCHVVFFPVQSISCSVVCRMIHVVDAMLIL